MPTIKITNIQDASPSKDYRYSDITMELQPSKAVAGDSLYKEPVSTDLMGSYDEQAIKNSLINLFNTTPGEKLLNPTFGLNLKRYLFEPVTDLTARIIGETIYEGITTFEPRVKIGNISVKKNIEQQQFEITISISIPKLSNRSVSFKGVLTKEQFSSTNE